MNDPRGAVKFEFVRYTRGLGLDLGYGPYGSFPQFIKVRRRDDRTYVGTGAHFLECDSFVDLEDIADGSCDFVVAAAVLPEGFAAHRDYLAEWLRCVKVGGHVCIYEPEANASQLRDTVFCYAELADSVALELVRCEDWPAGGAFLIVAKREGVPAIVENLPRAGKTACVVRHGGIGDQIQAAFLLPQLKREGYHVTVLTTERCRRVLEHDPHIDEWFMVDHDHVPAAELPAFWRTIARHYDKFVNLNESVEGTFLPAPGRPAHAWPHALRHEMLNHNYAEFAAKLAEIPFVPEGEFWPNADELAWREEFLANLPLAKPLGSAPVFTILWVLAGSSPHKFTPHQDNLIAAILERLKRAVVVMVGDEFCKILECGWEAEPRVVRMSGELDLRKTLTLARGVDLVIGPETGVLNSVAYVEEVRKIVLLSHSSHENLTKHWKNTVPVEGNAPCYPCHRLHFTSEFCPQDEETHAAICQKGVDPHFIFWHIDAAYTAWAKVQLLRSA